MYLLFIYMYLSSIYTFNFNDNIIDIYTYFKLYNEKYYYLYILLIKSCNVY